MLPYPANPAVCPACGGHFPVEEALAVGMPMTKLKPGHIAICMDCWTPSITDDGEVLRLFEDKDIAAMGRARYAQFTEALAEARNSTHGAAKV